MNADRHEFCTPQGWRGNMSGWRGTRPERFGRSTAGLRCLSIVIAALAIGAGCGGGDTATTSPDTTQTTADPISLGDLLERGVEGSAGDTVLVSAVLVDDGSGMRMCEALAESFPPQCAGRSIGVRHLEVAEVPLTEEQGVRWTDRAVWLVGWVEDGVFVVS